MDALPNCRMFRSVLGNFGTQHTFYRTNSIDKLVYLIMHLSSVVRSADINKLDSILMHLKMEKNHNSICAMRIYWAHMHIAHAQLNTRLFLIANILAPNRDGNLTLCQKYLPLILEKIKTKLPTVEYVCVCVLCFNFIFRASSFSWGE